MIFIKKYILFINLIISVMLIYRLSPITSIQNQANLGLSGIGIILGLLNSNIVFSKESFKAFGVIWGLLIINFLYQFTFGWLDIKLIDFLYLSAKISSTFIIALSIAYNYKFYLDNFLKFLGYFILLLFIIGIGSGDFGGTRSYLGFGNPNEAGLVAAIGFGVFLIYDGHLKIMKFFGIFVMLSAVLLSGSRAAFLLILIAGMFTFKLDIKFFTILLLGVFTIFYLFPLLGIEVVVLDRILGTYDASSGALDLNREGEFMAGYLMFQNKFWTGYGLTAYKFVDFSILPSSMDEVLGTHNGYLAAAKSYGIVFLIPFLYVIFSKTIFLFRKFIKMKDSRIKTHVFIITVVLIGGFFEDYFVGINSFATNIFFISVSVLGYSWRVKVKARKLTTIKYK